MPRHPHTRASPSTANEWAPVVAWLVERAGSQKALAARLHVTRQTIAKWVSGESTPRGTTRAMITLEYHLERKRILDAIPKPPIVDNWDA